MNKPYLFLSLLLTLCLSAPLGAQAAAAAKPAHDIRVLIDVSGSMKKNDPANLRVPALRLLTGVLPAGTQAGVWTFGRYVNMLVPYGAVTAAWRAQAMGAADRINSAGLYTDIEAALETATWNWTAAAPDARRSIILLTDGLVDVSDSADADRASRARITERILPRLQGSGAAVYTVALSDGADEILLQQLAATTGGGFERADSAEQLERIFFRMFEKAASPATLPLTDNKILVDDSIEELTLLVFRRQNAPATTLTAPDGAIFEPARLPPNARWHKDARYDLVTIERPMTGVWHVNADIDPDNRVMVVSNLRVVATQLPNQILRGDAHDLLVRFTEKDRAIAKKEFLDLLTVRLLESGAGGEPSERLLLDNGRDGDIAAGDGVFSARLDTSGADGHRTLVVDVDGTTFKRQHRQDVELVEGPVIADLRTDESGAVLFVIPRAGLIKPETLEAYATITDDDGLSDNRRLTRANPGEWRLALGGYPPEASYRLTLEIEGERPDGKPISYQGKPLRFGAAALPPEISDADADDDMAPDDEAADESEEAEETDEEIAEPEHTNWILVVSLVTLLNLFMGGGLYLGYRKLFGVPAETAADEEPAAEAPAAAPAETPPAAAAVINHSQPSIVTQVAAAAAAETRGETDAEDAAAKRDGVGSAMGAATPESPGPAAGPGEPEPGDSSIPATAGTAAGSHDSSPELVMEDETGQAAPEEIDEQLKNLSVEEIDLGFEDKARSAG